MNIIFSLVLCMGMQVSAQELIWEEDFEGDSLNMENWSYETENGCPDLCGWGNNERQIYSQDYVEVNDKNLVLTADKIGDWYYSGKVNTKNKFEFQYVTVEVRAKLPDGRGLWPAIWMLGNNIDGVGWPASGEIDIMDFVGRQSDTIHNALHTPASHGDTEKKTTPVKNATSEFRVFKMNWTEDVITFYIDGENLYLCAFREK